MQISRRRIESATNTCGISPKLDLITGADENTDYYTTLMNDIETYLRSVGVIGVDSHQNVDSISLIVYDESKDIQEFKIPYEDLTEDLEKDKEYILDAVLAEIDVR